MFWHQGPVSRKTTAGRSRGWVVGGFGVIQTHYIYCALYFYYYYIRSTSDHQASQTPEAGDFWWRIHFCCLQILNPKPYTLPNVFLNVFKILKKSFQNVKHQIMHVAVPFASIDCARKKETLGSDGQSQIWTLPGNTHTTLVKILTHSEPESPGKKWVKVSS